MPDPLGDPSGEFSTFLTSRATNLEALDLLRTVRRKARGNVGAAGPDLPELPPSVRVWIQNNTGADLDPFRVVALGAPLTSIEDSDNGSYNFARQPSFSATTPSATTDAFAILDEPCRYEAGGVGPLARAVVQGVIPVDVNVTDAGHNYATPTAADNTKLTSAASGPARIIYKPGGTGTLRCVVKLDESAAASSTTITHFEAAQSLDYAITADNAKQDTGLSMSIGAGTYFLYATVTGHGVLGVVGTAPSLYAELWNDTDSTLIAGDDFLTPLTTWLNNFIVVMPIMTVVTSTGTKTVKMRGMRRSNGSTWTTSIIKGSNFGNGTRMGWIRLA